MTDTLERLVTEVRKLSPEEWMELRVWLAEHQPSQDLRSKAAEKRVDWSDHFARVEKIFEGMPPLQENAVLALRREERY